MKFRTLFILMFFGVSGHSQDLHLDQEINILNPSAELILSPNLRFIENMDTIINNVKYSIGIEENKITFISTNDHDFTLVNGDQPIGNTLLKNGLKVEDLTKIDGWGYYIPIIDGWFGGVDFYSELSPVSKIDWVFKYNFY